MVNYITQWAKTWKKFQFQICIWVVAWLLITSMTKINAIWNVFFTPGLGDPPIEIFSKNVDLTLWGKQWIVLPKWTFFPHFSLLCIIKRIGESRATYVQVPLGNKIRFYQSHVYSLAEFICLTYGSISTLRMTHP